MAKCVTRQRLANDEILGKYFASLLGDIIYGQHLGKSWTLYAKPSTSQPHKLQQHFSCFCQPLFPRHQYQFHVIHQDPSTTNHFHAASLLCGSQSSHQWRKFSHCDPLPIPIQSSRHRHSPTNASTSPHGHVHPLQSQPAGPCTPASSQPPRTAKPATRSHPH